MKKKWISCIFLHVQKSFTRVGGWCMHALSLYPFDGSLMVTPKESEGDLEPLPTIINRTGALSERVGQRLFS